MKYPILWGCSVKIRVYYEDTDMGGVVYHSNYLNFCERARSELFFARGETPLFEGGHFVVRHIEADFIKPARLGDMLDIQTRLEELKSASLTMRQKIYRGEEMLFDMRVRLAYLMSDGRIGRVDMENKSRLLEILYSFSK